MQGSHAVSMLGGQRGFVDHVVMVLGALLVLALAGRFVYWVATEEDFKLVAGILWVIGFVCAYFLSADDALVARMPAGFAVFLLISIAAVPLTLLGESRIALLALFAAQLAFSYHAGEAITRRRPARPGRDGDIVAALGKWSVLVFAAVFFLVVAPLLALLPVSLVIDLSQQQIKWLVAAWGLVGVAWFGLFGGGARWGLIPAGALIYLPVTAIVLAADAVTGPFAEGTGVQVAYTTLPGALIVATAEIFVFGAARRADNKEEDSA